jgi:hypothetical protein
MPSVRDARSADADYAIARDHIFSVGDEIGVGFVGRPAA